MRQRDHLGHSALYLGPVKCPYWGFTLWPRPCSEGCCLSQGGDTKVEKPPTVFRFYRFDERVSVCPLGERGLTMPVESSFTRVSSSLSSRARKRAHVRCFLALGASLFALVFGLPAVAVTFSTTIASAQPPAKHSAPVPRGESRSGAFGFAGTGRAPAGYPPTPGVLLGHPHRRSSRPVNHDSLGSLHTSAGRLRPMVTNSEGDILTVTDAVAGSFTATGWDTEYVSSSGAVDYENCLAPSPPMAGPTSPSPRISPSTTARTPRTTTRRPPATASRSTSMTRATPS